MKMIHLGIDKITKDIVWQVGKGRKVKVEPKVIKHLNEIRKKLEKKLENGKAYYGINTGVGRLADKILSYADLAKFQEDLVISHSAGWGEEFKKEIIRMAMFLRLYMLSKGFSGISAEPVKKLEEFLNKELTPYVPMKGSLGASGDLAPLAHIALSLIGKGKTYFKDKLYPTHFALKITDTKPLNLKPKEALSLMNGTQFSLSMLIYSFIYLKNLLDVYDKGFLFSFIATGGNLSILDKSLISLRKNKFEENISKIYREFLKDYKNKKKKKIVQDPYSFRCMPQVRGSCEEIINFTENIIDNEIEAITDNPVFIDNKIISGGNFIGIRLSFAIENLKKVIAVLSNISERRISHLMGSDVINMPPFLSSEPGKKSGLMILHVTSASLTSLNKALSFPSISDSISTSGSQEDYVPMTMNSAITLMEMVENFEGIVLSELYAGVRACIMQNIELPSLLKKYLDEKFKNLNIFTDDLSPFYVLEKLKSILMENI
jgi:histidine ammonia-lyase